MLRNLPVMLAALLPAVVLCVYIYKKDRVEKEPPRLLLALLALGAFAVLPAGVVENVLTVIHAAISGDLTYDEGFGYHLYQLTENFLFIALTEETAKWLVVRRLTANHKSFNSLFDGIVYCVFVSLGFAGAENIGYVMQFGFSTALVRAFTAVPGHMFFGVIMGYYYSMWHVQYQARQIEAEMQLYGYLPRTGATAFNTGTPLAKSLLLPVLVHGFYDYCCSFSSVLSGVLFYVFLAGLYFLCFSRVAKLSKNDTHSGKLAMGMVFRRYPEVAAGFGIEHTPEYAAESYTGEPPRTDGI